MFYSRQHRRSELIEYCAEFWLTYLGYRGRFHPQLLKDLALFNSHCSIASNPLWHVRVVVKRKIWLVGILAVANIVLLVSMALGMFEAPTRDTPAGATIPAIDVLTDTGHRLLLSSLTGKALVIQFVNPQVSTQVDAVTKLLTSFEASEVQLVLITEQSRELRRLLPELSDDVIVVQSKYAELKKAFEVPDCCERRFVFDEAGKLVYRDYYYEELTPRLNTVVKKSLPPVSTAVREVLMSCNTGHVPSLRERTRFTDPGKAVVIFFTSVSSTCPSGELIKFVSRQVKLNDVEVLVLLPADYSRADIENFNANLKVKFVVKTFDPELAERWTSLVGRYGEAKINGSVAFINRGEISVANEFAELESELSRL